MLKLLSEISDTQRNMKIITIRLIIKTLAAFGVWLVA